MVRPAPPPILRGGTGLYLAVLGCTGLYWPVIGCTGLYWAELGHILTTKLFWPHLMIII